MSRAKPKPVWVASTAKGAITLARVGYLGDELIVEWCGVGRLLARRDGSYPRFQPAHGANPIQVAKIERGAAQVLLRSLAGHLGFHGAAVSLADRAIVFLGEARDGKSTLAAAFCARMGARLLADDAVALELASEWCVQPLERHHVLHDDALRALDITALAEGTLAAKMLVAATGATPEATRLAALVRLSFDDACEAPELRELTPVSALAEIVPQVTRFILDDAVRNVTEMNALMNLVRSVPVFELVRPRRFEELDRGMTLIAEKVSRLHAR